MGLKKVNAGFVKLDKLDKNKEGHQEISGILLKVLDMPVQGRTRPGVVLQLEDGTSAKVPLGESVREDLPLLDIGAKYLFRYAGSQASAKGNDTKKFDIFEVDED